MKYYIRYKLKVEAGNDKKLKQKLSLIEMQIKMKDKAFTKEIITEEELTFKDQLNIMEF